LVETARCLVRNTALLRLGSAVIAAAVFAVALQAHHANISIDLSTAVWVKGTVVRFDRINPHTIIELDEAVGADQRRWRIEGPFLARLERMGGDGPLFAAGDVIEACGFPRKDAAADAQRLIHGHVLVLPNGRLRSWGPYGKIDNCVRPGDDPSRWLALLKSDPQAREAWCDKARAAIPTRTESRALVEEIDRSLAQPCR
jgi:hypothetical protein